MKISQVRSIEVEVAQNDPRAGCLPDLLLVTVHSEISIPLLFEKDVGDQSMVMLT